MLVRPSQSACLGPNELCFIWRWLKKHSLCPGSLEKVRFQFLSLRQPNLQN